MSDLVRQSNILGGPKNIVGSSNADLVLESLGKIYIKTGRNVKLLDDVFSLFDKYKGDTMDLMKDKVIIVDNIFDLDYPGDGSLILDTSSNSFYIAYQGLYLLITNNVANPTNRYVKKTGDTMTGQLTIRTSRAPLIVTSKQLISNLNAEFINGLSKDEIAIKALNEFISGSWTFENNILFKSNVKFNKYVKFESDIEVDGKTKLNDNLISKGDIITTGSIGSPEFASGFNGYGWRMDSTTNMLTVDYLVVRKAMQVFELIVNQINATNGSLWVTDSCEVSKVDYINIISDLNTIQNNVWYVFNNTDNVKTVSVNNKNLCGSDCKYTNGTTSFITIQYIFKTTDIDKLKIAYSNNPNLFKNKQNLENLDYVTVINVFTEYLNTIYNITTTPKYLITPSKEYINRNEIISIFTYYKYYGTKLNNFNISQSLGHLKNIFVVKMKDDKIASFREGDLIRCLKFLDNNIKYYDALVCSRINDYSYIITTAESVFDKYTEIKYDSNGNVIKTELYNTHLYEKTINKTKYDNTDLSESPELYLNKNADDLILTTICEKDGLVRIGHLNKRSRQNSVYITSSENDSPYVQTISEINKPDYSVLYTEPDWCTVKKPIDGFLQDVYYEPTTTSNSQRYNYFLLEGKPYLWYENPTINCCINPHDKQFKTKYKNPVRARFGNLQGIYNSKFPKNKLPYGYGLYGENVFLTGEFYLNTGLSVVDFTKDLISLVKGNSDLLEKKLSSLEKLLNSKYDDNSSKLEFDKIFQDGLIDVLEREYILIEQRYITQIHDTLSYKLSYLKNKFKSSLNQNTIKSIDTYISNLKNYYNKYNLDLDKLLQPDCNVSEIRKQFYINQSNFYREVTEVDKFLTLHDLGDIFNDFKNSINASIESLKNQLDKKIEFNFSDNEKDIYNTTLKEENLGDYLIINHDTNKIYKCLEVDGEYKYIYYNYIKGEDTLLDIMLEASNASVAADGKIRVFNTDKETLPTPPYDRGDLWVNAFYLTLYAGDLLVCKTSCAIKDLPKIDDWEKASDYVNSGEINSKLDFIASDKCITVSEKVYLKNQFFDLHKEFLEIKDLFSEGNNILDKTSEIIFKKDQKVDLITNPLNPSNQDYNYLNTNLLGLLVNYYNKIIELFNFLNNTLECWNLKQSYESENVIDLLTYFDAVYLARQEVKNKIFGNLDKILDVFKTSGLKIGKTEKGVNYIMMWGDVIAFYTKNSTTPTMLLEGDCINGKLINIESIKYDGDNTLTNKISDLDGRITLQTNTIENRENLVLKSEEIITKSGHTYTLSEDLEVDMDYVLSFYYQDSGSSLIELKIYLTGHPEKWSVYTFKIKGDRKYTEAFQVKTPGSYTLETIINPTNEGTKIYNVQLQKYKLTSWLPNNLEIVTDAKLQISKGEIKASVSETITTEINKLEIGNRNYIKNSNAEYDKNHNLELTQPWEYFLGKSIIISFDYNYTNVSTGGAQNLKRFGLEKELFDNNSGSTNYIYSWVILGSNKTGLSKAGRYFRKMKVPSSIRQKSDTNLPLYILVLSGTVKMSNFKLEIGDVPTEWSPAPEDLKGMLLDVAKLSADVKLLPGQFIATTQQAMKASRNLLRSSYERTIPRQKVSHNFDSIIPTEKIKENTKYIFQVGKTEIIWGNPDKFTVSIFDFTKQRVLATKEVAINLLQLEYAILKTPESILKDNDIRFIYYAGIAGKTYDIELILHKIKLEVGVGENPTYTEWSPAPEDVGDNRELIHKNSSEIKLLPNKIETNVSSKLLAAGVNLYYKNLDIFELNKKATIKNKTHNGFIISCNVNWAEVRISKIFDKNEWYCFSGYVQYNTKSKSKLTFESDFCDVNSKFYDIENPENSLLELFDGNKKRFIFKGLVKNYDSIHNFIDLHLYKTINDGIEYTLEFTDVQVLYGDTPTTWSISPKVIESNESHIEQLSNKITLSVKSTVVGNLLWNSELNNSTGWGLNVNPEFGYYHGFNCLKCTKVSLGVYCGNGNEYNRFNKILGYITCSVDVYVEGSLSANIRLGIESLGEELTVSVRNKWVRINKTFLIDNTKNSFVLYLNLSDRTVYFKNVKMELGLEATPWSPSVELLQSEIKLMPNRIQLQVNKSLSNENLLQNSTLSNVNGWHINGSNAKFVAFKGYQCLYCYNAGDGVYTFNLTILENVGKQVTISVDVFIESQLSEIKVWLGFNSENGAEYIKKENFNKWVRISHTLTIPSNYSLVCYLMSGDGTKVHFKNIKMELGDMPTPWVLARADVENYNTNRNLIKNSSLEHSLVPNDVQEYLLTEDFNNFVGKKLPLSFDYKYSRISTGDTLITSRFGFEVSQALNSENKGVWPGVFCNLVKNTSNLTNSGRFKGILDLTNVAKINGNIIFYNLVKDGTITISNVKLEEGEIATAWTPAPEDYAATKKELLATGIDIDAHNVTLTAEKFKIQSRNGGEPIAVFADKDNGGIRINDGLSVGDDINIFSNGMSTNTKVNETPLINKETNFTLHKNYFVYGAKDSGGNTIIAEIKPFYAGSSGLLCLKTYSPSYPTALYVENGKSVFNYNNAKGTALTVNNSGGTAIEANGLSIFNGVTKMDGGIGGMVHISGLKLNFRKIEKSTESINTNDDFIECGNPSIDITINMPSSASAGKILFVKRIYGRKVTLYGNFRRHEDFGTWSNWEIPATTIQFIYDGAYWVIHL